MIEQSEIDIIIDLNDDLWYEKFFHKIYLHEMKQNGKWWHNVIAEIIVNGELHALGTPLEIGRAHV